MFKRILAIIMTVALLSSVTIHFTFAAPQDINIVIGGSKITPSDTKPEMIDGRVFVPLRLISENLGVGLQWDSVTNTVSAPDKFTHVVGTSYVTLANGKKTDIGVNSYIKNGSTMVSARMIAEALGCEVEWNGSASTVNIVKPGTVGLTTGQPSKKDEYLASLAYVYQLEDKIANALTQQEMNIASSEAATAWDSELNRIYGLLQEKLTPSKMSDLRTKQREWIKARDQAINEAGAEFEGGSIQPLVMNSTNHEFTKKRTLELIDLYFAQ